MESEKDNLIQGLLSNINRVKAMITEYKALPKNAGFLAARLMQADVDMAEKSIIEMDTVQMVISFKALNEYEN